MKTEYIENIVRVLLKEIIENPDSQKLFEKSFDESTGDFRLRIEQIGVENLSKEYAERIEMLLPPRDKYPDECPNCGEPL